MWKPHTRPRISKVCLAVIVAGLLLPSRLLVPAQAAPSQSDQKQGGKQFPSAWFWGNARQKKVHEAMVGQPAPQLSLEHWINGELSRDDIKGKILVIDFWATWCPPCLAAIPHTNKIAEEYSDKGVVVLGVCCSGLNKFDATVKQHHIHYHVAEDVNKISQRAWRIFFFPTYAIVDRHGIVRAVGLMPNYVEPALKQVLQEQPPKDSKKKS